MAEAQTCPRRMLEIGPWPREENLDLWVSDRWLADKNAVQAKHAREDAESLRRHNEIMVSTGRPEITLEEYRTTCFIRGASNDIWLWSWGPPRTCDFCGSIHPEDAFRLLEEGWEQEFAKQYKCYLAPPGTRVRQEAFLASIQDGSRQPGQAVPSVWSPTPPVKLYIQHCTSEQIDKLNEMLRVGRRS